MQFLKSLRACRHKLTQMLIIYEALCEVSSLAMYLHLNDLVGVLPPESSEFCTKLAHNFALPCITRRPIKSRNIAHISCDYADIDSSKLGQQRCQLKTDIVLAQIATKLQALVDTKCCAGFQLGGYIPEHPCLECCSRCLSQAWSVFS